MGDQAGGGVLRKNVSGESCEELALTDGSEKKNRPSGAFRCLTSWGKQGARALPKEEETKKKHDWQRDNMTRTKPQTGNPDKNKLMRSGITMKKGLAKKSLNTSRTRRVSWG